MPTSRARALMTMFGLTYPIFEAPHGPTVTSPELAIAVSNAGAMGAIALTDIPPDKASAVVSRIRAATRGSFFANYILAVLREKEPSSLRAVLDAGAPVVQFSWGLPAKGSISAIRSAGAKFGMQVGGTESARAALDLGADYLVLPGTGSRGPCATHEWAVRGTAESVERGQREACYRFPGGSAMAMESAKHCCPEPGEQCLAQGSSRRSRAMHTHPIKRRS